LILSYLLGRDAPQDTRLVDAGKQGELTVGKKLPLSDSRYGSDASYFRGSFYGPRSGAIVLHEDRDKSSPPGFGLAGLFVCIAVTARISDVAKSALIRALTALSTKLFTTTFMR
jgi:hypothetical protein